MIQFTQYLRPNGTPKPVTINRPEDIEKLAADLIGNGCRFEIEELLTGEVSMTCERSDGDDTETLAIQVVPNGPQVPEAVDKMVREAWEELYRAEAK